MVTDTGSSRLARSTRRLNAQRLNNPRPALVLAHADGIPHRVNRLQVALVREEWRIVDRWWTEEPVDRRYFDLVLESGENTVVYRNGETQTWFTQRA
ncbi:MAG TPA: hypothetical protein VG265_12410 [Gaiellaceae bacterium]|nr:hypothetical protein [Gaiellaceae bacterium]